MKIANIASNCYVLTVNKPYPPIPVMRRATIMVILIGLSSMYSCKVDKICAAYQSYYLISPTVQPSNFSVQDNDTIFYFYQEHPSYYEPELFALVSENGLPRKDLPNTEKDKNGLIKSEWALVKNWNKRIVPMEVVYPEIPDSLRFLGDNLMLTEVDVIDSVALDSARNTAQTYKYNNDQKFYNWYFRDKLVWEDEASTEVDNKKVQDAPNQVEQAPEKKKFIQGLFKKKDKAKKEQLAKDSIN